MDITKIVITGGPCAGKSTAMGWIRDAFTPKGYEVLFVPETATELISSGVTPETCGSRKEFQKRQLRRQIEREKEFVQCASSALQASSTPAEKVLLVCDRGAMDTKAYLTGEEFAAILEELGTNEVDLRDGYDAVFHLVTAAKGAEASYSTANNSARTETASEAAALDDRVIAAWTGHPHLRVIDNSSGFDNKMQRLIAEVSAFLGIPEPYEIERKFLIEYPDIAWLESLPNCRRVEIVQTYLHSADGEGIRLRKRGLDGHYIYVLTSKQWISDIRRIEIERRLTEEEYRELLQTPDPERRTLCKDRYCLTYDSHYFEIDVYPFWSEQAVVEIELREEGESFTLPPQLNVIREATGDRDYTNYTLAQKYGTGELP